MLAAAALALSLASIAARPVDQPDPPPAAQCIGDCVQRVLLVRSEARSRKRLMLARRFERQRNRLRRIARASTAPSVSYAIHLASRVFAVPEYQMRNVAACESHFDPYATNGRYKGVFQLGWSPFGMSPFDPVANALSAAQTVQHDGSWRQWECKP